MSHASEFIDNIKHKIESTFDKASRRLSHDKNEQQVKDNAGEEHLKGQHAQHGHETGAGSSETGANVNQAGGPYGTDAVPKGPNVNQAGGPYGTGAVPKGPNLNH
ncbi:hypothetical protein IWW48_003528 [Coemansia sp. RSA 1200]|nr:hypothetical protein IWW48_003528 [Coemansia sp. RSA 1200]